MSIRSIRDQAAGVHTLPIDGNGQYLYHVTPYPSTQSMASSYWSVFDGDRSIDATVLKTLAGRVQPSSEETMAVEAPLTGERLASVPMHQSHHIATVVDEARASHEDWRETPVNERAAILERFASVVEANRELLLDCIQLETGKARLDALEEVLDVILTARYYAQHGPTILADTPRRGVIPGVTDVTEIRRPKGVVGVISPWNYPLAIPMDDTLPAVFAGNAVVIKPDEKTPFSTLLAVALLEEAGVPTGVVSVVTGSGSTVGSALIDSVDHVAFTGSVPVGRLVGGQAGDRMIGATLELGGKNPLLILDDIDPETAADGAVWSSFSNAGQLCLTTERIIIAEEQYDAFVEAFLTASDRLELGGSFEFGPTVGSLISRTHLRDVHATVDEAVNAGATVLRGGECRRDLGPAFYEPTILADVPANSRVLHEEVFGPVVTVERAPDEASAIERANETDHCLHAVIWTGDTGRGDRVARTLDAGMVSVNDTYQATYGSVDAPMGSPGSGGGYRQGRPGLMRYVDRQTITIQRGPALHKPSWLPTTLYAKVLNGLVRLQKYLPRRLK